MRPSVASPTGTLIERAGVVRDGAAREPVGRVHRDGAHAVVAQVLLHLGHQHAALAAIAGIGISSAL